MYSRRPRRSAVSLRQSRSAPSSHRAMRSASSGRRVCTSIRWTEIQVEQSVRVFQQLPAIVGSIRAAQAVRVPHCARRGVSQNESRECSDHPRCHSRRQPPLAARTDGRRAMSLALSITTFVCCTTRPARAKTYLAVRRAVTQPGRAPLSRIVLLRPASRRGTARFLPGYLVAKINPYLRPLIDALNDMRGRSRS